MILDIFKTKSDLLKEINLLKEKVEVNKNLIGRFKNLHNNKKTIPTKTTRDFLNNLELQLNEIK
mgnify:CR=1 FL=1